MLVTDHDELSQPEREAISAEMVRRTTFHLKAIKQTMLDADVFVDTAELTRLAGQIYMDGFREAVFKHTVTRMQANQLPLVFDPKATSH